MNALRHVATACLLITMSASSLISPATAADLSDLRGSWNGRGGVKEKPDGPNRRGSCRVSISGSGSSISLSGRCAAPGKSATFGGAITQRGGDNVSARFSSPSYPSVSYAGTQNGGAVYLYSTNAVTVDGRTYRLQLYIRSQGANSFSMTQQATEVGTGQRSQVFNMAFQRK